MFRHIDWEQVIWGTCLFTLMISMAAIFASAAIMCVYGLFKVMGII